MDPHVRLDEAVLQELKLVMEGDLGFLLSTFLHDSEDRFRDIEHALGDWQALCRAAHSFKGSAANVGAAALSQRCLELETFCQTVSAAGSREEATKRQLVDAIETELHATREALDAYLASLDPNAS